MARTIYGLPKLVVLDEPNAHLDGAGEQALAGALRSLKEQNATVVLVTHRLNILRHADRIMVMENGGIERIGGRDTILGELDPPGEGRMSAVTAETATAVERAGSVKGPLLVTVAVLLVFFGVFGGWAALVPLSGAAIAPAVVAPDGFRKTIQHLEGGIVSQIRVREGSTVEAGDVLVVLDDVRTRAEYNTARARLAATLAKACAAGGGAAGR